MFKDHVNEFIRLFKDFIVQEIVIGQDVDVDGVTMKLDRDILCKETGVLSKLMKSAI